MKKNADLVWTAVVALLASLISPIAAQAAYPNPPQGSGYPYTRVIAGQHSTGDCPSGFQHATGLINDLSWPKGQRSFTECWPEAAFVANRLGGNVWQAFKDSGGTLSVDELYAVQEAWRDYDQAIEDAQAAAEEESRKWNEANPGKQKCVQWGPVVAPDGVGQSSGGVCANPVSAPAGDASSSPSTEGDSSTSPSTSSAEVGNGESDSSTSSSAGTDSQDEKIAVPEPTNLKLSNDANAVYLTVENGKSKKISVRFAGKWSVFYPSSDSETKAFFPGQSGFVSMTVFVDGKLKLSNFVKVDKSKASESKDVEASKQSESPTADETTDSGSIGQPATIKVSLESGLVKIRVLNADGRKLSAKIDGKWLVSYLPDDDHEVTRRVTSGKAIEVSTYLDRVLISTERLEVGDSTEVSDIADSSTESATTTSGVATSSSATLTSSQVVQIEVRSTDNDISFNLLNALGRKISIQLGGRWLVNFPTSNNQKLAATSIRGLVVPVKIYVDSAFLTSFDIQVGSTAFTTTTNKVQEDDVSSSSSSTTSPPASAQSEDGKATIGSEGGQIFVDLIDMDSRKISLRVGGRWFVFYPDADSYRYSVTSIVGTSVEVALYADGELMKVTQLEVTD